MGGIKSQPAPKPSQLPSPVPEIDPFSAAVVSGEGEADPFAGAQINAVGAAGAQENAGAPQETGLLASGLQLSADIAPAGLALGGAFMAGPALVPAAAMAMGLGAIGMAYRQIVEQNILHSQPSQGPLERIQGMKETAGGEGLAQVVGTGIMKGIPAAGKALGKTKAGAAVYEKAAQLAEEPLSYVKGVIESARTKLQEPLMKIVASKGTSMNTEMAGDAAKNLIKGRIEAKYGTFKVAYENLDAVAQNLHITDEMRRGFTQKLKDWAMNKSGDEYKAVKKFADELDAADNGARFMSEIKRLNGVIRPLMNAGDTELGTTLRAARDMAHEFYEGQTTKLAAKISAGKGTPEEINLIRTLMQQRGIQDDPVKYAKSIAGDYLKDIKKVRTEYATFRNFLEDVAEQTKTRATNKGPMAFLDNLDDIPSEKLIERMFDIKNARALRTMQTETPGVFKTVVSSKFQQLVNKSTSGGMFNPFKFRKLMEELPESTQGFLMDSAEMKVMHQVLASPKLRGLDALERLSESNIRHLMQGALEVVKDTGGTAIKAAAEKPVVRQAVGKAVTPRSGQ